MTEDTIKSALENECNRELLKYVAGRRMFCDCGKVMDWRRTLVLDVKSAAGEATFICCRRCWEKAERADVQRIHALLRKAKEHGFNGTIELTANFDAWSAVHEE